MTRFEDVIERDGRLVYTNVGDSSSIRLACRYLCRIFEYKSSFKKFISNLFRY